MSACKFCKSDAVDTLTDYEDISYKGSVLRIKVEYSLCNSCEREFLSKEQIMKNDRVLRDAKKVNSDLFEFPLWGTTKQLVDIVTEQRDILVENVLEQMGYDVQDVKYIRNRFEWVTYNYDPNKWVFRIDGRSVGEVRIDWEGDSVSVVREIYGTREEVKGE